MKDYIKYQLSRTFGKSVNEKVLHLNVIYAVLDERGYDRKEIKIAIDECILENIQNQLDRVKQVLKDYNNL